MTERTRIAQRGHYIAGQTHVVEFRDSTTAPEITMDLVSATQGRASWEREFRKTQDMDNPCEAHTTSEQLSANEVRLDGVMQLVHIDCQPIPGSPSFRRA